MSKAEHEEIWDRFEAGESWTAIGLVIGRRLTSVREVVIRHGGRRPEPPTAWSDKRLCLSEREEISRGLAVGTSFRKIAGRIGRAPSTVSREVNVNGGRRGYRAMNGEASIRERAKRPKVTKLESNSKLRDHVEAKLAEFWSPEQISARLRVEHVDDLSMRISHESIHAALYHGSLAAKPRRCLRTRRPMRRRKNRRQNSGQGSIKDPVLIHQRPAEANDRVEVGHWEGDLVIGNRRSAIATLVERVTRFTVLVPLQGARTMAALNTAVTAVFDGFPDRVTRSLAWDQGKEIAGHAQLAAATGLDVYLCDPRSPWQRGTNENTNGLLRQWFPRSTNFYGLDPAEIDRVATSLNSRPRRTLGWQTPAELFAAIS